MSSRILCASLLLLGTLEPWAAGQTQPLWKAESNQAHSGFAGAVSAAGDVNGDGYGDILVGAYQFDGGLEYQAVYWRRVEKTAPAVVYGYLGSPAGLATSADWAVEGNQAYASFGAWVSTAGDVAASTILSHVNSSVSFVNGEGPGSVLRGFTVTGNNFSHAAIKGPGATPRIERCVVRGNRPSVATIVSDATIEDCVIEDNQSSAAVSAGVFGAPTLRRCIFRGNGCYDSTALRLRGGRVEDCQIVGNGAGEGSGGGAVTIESSTSVVLERCLIAGNVKSTFGGQYCARGAGLQVTALSAPAILVNCTVTDNRVADKCFYGPDHGGLFGPVRLVNCILRGNDDLEFEAGVTSAVYSDVEGGIGGTGNLDADPLFRDAANGDYRLLPGSPCIDSGSPGSPLDFDGSRADMGALAFTHAVTSPVNGRGLNLPLLTSSNAPVLGSTWTLVVHAALVDRPAVSGVAIKKSALQPGLLTPYGELLIAGTRIDEDHHSSNGVADSFVYAVPSDLALLGFECFAQGFVIRQGAFDVELGNALRVVLGL